MKDEYGLIDLHKLVCHPEWVRRWHAAQGNWELARNIYPLYIEVSPAGQCNHRCPWCAVDYIGYKKRILNFDRFKFALEGMTNRRMVGEDWNGVKSIMFAGEGEPTLHPKLAEMVVATKKVGIDVALTTNGTAMNVNFIDRALPHITWIKVSLDAASAPTHALNHHASLNQFALAIQDLAYASKLRAELVVKFKGEFEKILGNIRYACKLNAELGLNCMIGAQLLMNPTNIDEIYEFAKLMKEIGCDYCVIKPYSRGLYSTNRQEDILGSNFRYGDFLYLAEGLDELNSSGYNVVFRSRTMQSYEDADRRYAVCQATPMAWGYIMASGDFLSCSAYWPQDIGCGDQRFVLGNINSQGFDEIWEGELRYRNWEFVRNELNISECRKNCRMNAVNIFLWNEVRNSTLEDLEKLFPIIEQVPRNVNFI
jgi:MoaA/NifB/PqqE/SkfB family radical SAM enzyme